MISATNLQTGVSKPLLERQPELRNRADPRTFGNAAGSRSRETEQRSQGAAGRETLSRHSRVHSAAASLEGLRGRHGADTPADLLELMIMQMGGGPYSTYKGMHIDLAV